MRRAYYNENNSFAAAWLRELIKDDLIAPGDVDERDIRDVKPNDLNGYTQCHFFAGIGGWSYALRLAGWPDDRLVWTGSCPCQSFSTAGKRTGFDDPRHLWPVWFNLVRECRPSVVFGEQVSSAIGHGWLDLVSTDMESKGYTFGSAVLGACSVGAPHRRQRLYFVADAPNLRRLERRDSTTTPLQRECAERTGEHAEAGHAGELPGGLEGLCGDGGEPMDDTASARRNATIQGAESKARDEARMRGFESGRGDGELGDSKVNGHERFSIRTNGESPHGTPQANFWGNARWLPCRDGKLRPTEPTIFPLAHGIPNRVGLLRGAGNAIVPQVAVEFIKAFVDVASLRLTPPADVVS